MSLGAGSLTWAIVPFVPQAPFRVYAGEGQAPFTVPEASPVIDAIAKGGDPLFDYLVQAKVRPVLLLTDSVSESYDEQLALRLARLSKYSSTEQDRIRAGNAPALFHLDPGTSGLREESAVMIDSPVRVHASALKSQRIGAVNPYELRTIQERFILLHNFDVRAILSAAQQQCNKAKRKPG